MRAHSLLAFVAVALSSAWARADVPPPPDYVETCTIEKQQTATAECLECRTWVSHMNRCANSLVPYCFTKSCKTRGASAWTEVWCRTKNASAPVVPSATLTALGTADVNEPYSADPVVAPSTCASLTDTNPSTSTSTGTSLATSAATDTTKDSSGCTISDASGLRALGPLAVAGLAFALIRRRRPR
jgi:hypothetical protein